MIESNLLPTGQGARPVPPVTPALPLLEGLERIADEPICGAGASRRGLPAPVHAAIVVQAKLARQLHEDQLAGPAAAPELPVLPDPSTAYQWARQRPELGLPQSLSILTGTWPLARDRWESCERGHAPAVDDPGRWLDYVQDLANTGAVAMLYKHDIMLQSLVRVIERGNALAIAIAARALLENYAASFFVANKLEKARVVAGKGKTTDADLAQLETGLLRLLGAGAGETTPTPLSLRAKQLGLCEDTAIKDYMTTTFRHEHDEAAVGIWQRLSDILHGASGGVPVAGTAAAAAIRRIGIIVLAELGGLARQLDVVAELHRSVPRLATFGDIIDAGATVAEAGRTQREIRYWRAGTDFTGSGTRDDPYRFAAGLTYHHAYDSFLRKHLEVEVAKREPEFIEDIGLVDHVWPVHGKDIYLDPQYGLVNESGR